MNEPLSAGSHILYASNHLYIEVKIFWDRPFYMANVQVYDKLPSQGINETNLNLKMERGYKELPTKKQLMSDIYPEIEMRVRRFFVCDERYEKLSSYIETKHKNK